MPDVDVMMIGHFAKDRNIVDGRGEEAPGGAVYYGSIALRRLGLRVAVITRLHPNDFPLLEELRAEGVEVFATAAPQTSGIANYYQSADMERRVCVPLGFAGPIRESDIPALTASIYAVAPIIAGEVDLPLLRLLHERGPVALDVQGFVRVREERQGTGEGPALTFRPWADQAEGLKLVKYLKVDQAEAELLTGELDPRRAAQQLAVQGPDEIVLTQSTGITLLAAGEFYHAPFRPRSLAGRTGRGDTAFATYLGTRLSSGPEKTVQVAAAVTTLKQEQPGPWRGSLADLDALEKRDGA